MLNCCIARKTARESKIGHESVPVIEISDDDEEEEDEFFECDEEMEQEERREERKRSAPAWATAEGRLERIGDMKLLEVDEWMYRWVMMIIITHHEIITRPEVQEPAPVTEDQLAELSEVSSEPVIMIINQS